MNIIGIHSIVYGCENLKSAGRFLLDLGLEPIADDSAGVSYGLAGGSSLVLRPMDDDALPATLVDGNTAREIIWRVEITEVLKEIAAELSADRNVAQTPDGVLHVVDDLGYALGFKVAAAKPIELEVPVANTVGNRRRKNIRAYGAEPKMPKLLRAAHMGRLAPGDMDENKTFSYAPRGRPNITIYSCRVGVNPAAFSTLPLKFEISTR